jgi:tetraacyldisaccharide 4'-kinase
VSAILTPFAWLFQAIVSLRNNAYDRGWLVGRELPCPVISVGNLTVGGTGKTPMVITLAEKLCDMRIKVGILSRGYRRKSRGTVVVSDGRNHPLDPHIAGDEPALIARKLHGVPVVADEIRFRGGMQMIRQFQPEVILLDDGFQHRALHRNLDIVLLDASYPLSNIRLLPAGRLREPLSSLKRADLIIMTRATENHPNDDTLRQIASHTNAPIIRSTHNPEGWLSLKGKSRSITQGPKIINPLLVSGIARPDDFENTVRSLGITPAAHLTYPDHQIYGPKQLEQIAGVYRSVKADAIITTEKDLVKIPPLIEALNVWALRISVRITEGEDLLDRMLTELLPREHQGKKEGKSA